MRILIWLFLLIPNCLFAQEKGVEHISVTFSTGSPEEFFIEVYRLRSAIKIVYTFCDSTSDSMYPTYQGKLWVIDRTKNKDSILQLRHELDSLWTANSFYRSDSLEFSTNLHRDYQDLLSIMFSSEKCDFTNQTPNIITTDGYAVGVIINYQKHYLKIGAHSPRKDSYPLLTKFLTETLKIGFNSHCTSFLKSGPTFIGL